MKQHVVERMLYILLFLVFVVAIISSYFAAHTAETLTSQQKAFASQQEAFKHLLDGQGQTTKDINKSLACVLVFFSTPNKANYYISNFSNCTITSNETGESQVLQLPRSKDTNTQPTPTPSVPKPQENTPPLVEKPEPNILQATTESLTKGFNNLLWGLTHIERNK